MVKELTFLIIGAGSRGSAYARAITTSTPARIAAVAEPDPYKRHVLGEKYIWGPGRSPKAGQEFEGWREWIEYEVDRRGRAGRDSGSDEGVDGLLICTLDETHVEILAGLAVAELLDLHVLCEKPLALSLDDCLSVYAARAKAAAESVFSIGHVLRYSPHNLLLRRLVRVDKVIGDIVSVEHTEPVGFWHFAHSYVRGNWRRETLQGDGSLLTKSCHDVDFLVWLVEEPIYSTCSSPVSKAPKSDPNGSERFQLKLRSIHSTGHLTQFTPSRKPLAAGSATNCTTCPIERECVYSAVRIYRDNQLRKGERGWPVKIVCPDIEDYLPSTSTSDTQKAEDRLLSALKEDYDDTTPDEEIAKRTWYGRCVYESDNNVCDDQVVTMSWDTVPTNPDNGPEARKKKGKPSGITATLHMTAPTEAQCVRRGRIYGTAGEITYDSQHISIFSFATRETTVIDVPKQPPEEEESHGGGDYGLARGFVNAVDMVVNRGWSVQRAQREFVGCELGDVIRSHAVVFAAEESRRGEMVVPWESWWKGKLASVGLRS
ncbi:Gfo/Idh/MocA family protein [Aspergillus lucknowensis]|uniref:NAD binding Rossmann fold oxidoreductase n=1 Tax=Aspergillus lucknowensis TaxID=176173 RepID=A0ABR4LUP2_9EURO